MYFKDIIGYNEIKGHLIQTVKLNRISHAQLFLGTPGCGNLAMALAYSQYICCEQKTEDDSCGYCPSCIKHNKLIHPDLHFIFPVATTREITKHPLCDKFAARWRDVLLDNPYINLQQWIEHLGIENKQPIINAEECNEIIKKLSLKSFESEYKIMIIWMPEKLFHAAAPKLLKIIEEPPDKTLFLFVSGNYGLIMPTILSRLQLVKFGKIDSDSMIACLIDKFNFSFEQAAAIARIADGNYSEALRIAADKGNEIFYHTNFFTWMRLCFKLSSGDNIVKIVGWVEEIARTGRERQKSFLAYSLRVFRDCLMINYCHNELVRLTGKESDAFSKLAPFINEVNCIEMTAVFNDAISDIERNANAKIVFMDLSLKMAKFLRAKASGV